MKNLLFVLFFFTFANALNAQVYSTRSFQIMDAKYQYSFVGIANGIDSVDAANKAEANAKRALELAKDSRNGRGSFEEQTGSGIAVITEIKPSNFYALAELPKHYKEILDFELSIGTEIIYAGPYEDRHGPFETGVGTLVMYTFREGTKITGVRNTRSQPFTCRVTYVGKGVSHESYNPQDQTTARTSEMDTIIKAYYVWVAKDNQKVSHSQFQTFYYSLIDEFSKIVGPCDVLNVKVNNETGKGVVSRWTKSSLALEFIYLKKSREYRIRLLIH